MLWRLMCQEFQRPRCRRAGQPSAGEQRRTEAYRRGDSWPVLPSSRLLDDPINRDGFVAAGSIATMRCLLAMPTRRCR